MTHQETIHHTKLPQEDIPFPDAETSMEIITLLKRMFLTEIVTFWGVEDAQKLHQALTAGLIRRIELEYCVHNALIAFGRKSYNQHIRSKKYHSYIIFPDHTLSPRAFAYALEHGAFLKKEIRGIVFENESKEQFIATCGKDALSKTINELLDITSLHSKEQRISEEKSCECCC